MNLIPSVSRSSGLQDDGDMLKDLKFQEKYLAYIGNKLESYWQQYPAESHLASRPDYKQKHAQHDILILFRKLREGIIASHRLDEFTLQVYQTSLNLSVIFRVPIQTTAIVTQLIPHHFKDTGLYESVFARIVSELEAISPSALAEDLAALSLQGTPKSSQRDKTTKPMYQPPHKRRDKDLDRRDKSPAKPHPVDPALQIELTILISVLNTLVSEYPRQEGCHYLLRWFYCLHKGTFWQKDSPSFRYIKRLMEALIVNNFFEFERLTKTFPIKELCIRMSSSGDLTRIAKGDSLTQIAITVLLNDLRSKVQTKAWEILRVAYREADSMVSAEWLARALLLPGHLADNSLSLTKDIDTWLLDRPRTQVVSKEGIEGRWELRR